MNLTIARWLQFVLPAPFGWLLGMTMARLWVGPDMTGMPPWAEPAGLVLAYAFAFIPVGPVWIRLATIAVATGLLFASIIR